MKIPDEDLTFGEFWNFLTKTLNTSQKAIINIDILFKNFFLLKFLSENLQSKKAIIYFFPKFNHK